MRVHHIPSAAGPPRDSPLMAISDWLMPALGLLEGAAAGYIITSYLESFIHEHISDASPPSVRWFRRHPRISHFALRAWYSHHVIHHRATYRVSFTQQFRDDQERARLIRLLERRGPHGRLILDAEFATRLNGSGALVFVAPLFVVGGLLLWLRGATQLIGAIPPMLLAPALSHWVHPWLHEPVARVEREAAWPIARLLRSRYGRIMRRNHFLHHEYGGISNFNLLLGGDVLRRRLRRASEADLTRMAALGLLYDADLRR